MIKEPIILPSLHSQTKLSNITLKPLETYVESYILGKKHFQRPNWEMGLVLVLALIGAAWGLSWMDASVKAAVIFPAGVWREVTENLFKFGIVVTVGADGLWIMLTLCKKAGSKAPLTQQIPAFKKKLYQKILLIFLSFTSIIAPVYAAFKYNAGMGQLLAIIIFVGKFGYSLFGYSTFLDYAVKLWEGYFKNQKENQSLFSYKEKVLKNLKFLKENPILLSEFSSVQAFMQYILLSTPGITILKEGATDSYKFLFKKIIQSIAAFFIGAATFMVDTFLVSEALQKILALPIQLAFPLALTAALPTFAVMTLSSFRTLGEWLDSFLLKKPSSLIFEGHYPRFSKCMRLLAFLLSCLAPTAAAYITFDTLFGKVNLSLTWTAVAFMIASRTLFAYFSLNQLFSQTMIFFSRKGKGKKANMIDQAARLSELHDRMQSLSEIELKALSEGLKL